MCDCAMHGERTVCALPSVVCAVCALKGVYPAGDTKRQFGRPGRATLVLMLMMITMMMMLITMTMMMIMMMMSIMV